MSTKPKKRSLTLKGHRTSVSLEDKFWEEFCKIAERQNISINELASQLDVTRELNSISLASLIRDLAVSYTHLTLPTNGCVCLWGGGG